MRFLERLAGAWRATETLHPSPWNPARRTAEAALNARLAAGTLVLEYRRDGYEGLGVMRRSGGTYELWWFDELEPPGPAVGRGSGDRIVFERESPLGRARYTYAFLGDDEFRFRIERTAGGKEWKGFLDARYLRAPPPPLPS
jgi:hypothetical protein